MRAWVAASNPIPSPHPAFLPPKQDAHEFLNYLLNVTSELLEAQAKERGEATPSSTWVTDIFQVWGCAGLSACARARVCACVRECACVRVRVCECAAGGGVYARAPIEREADTALAKGTR